ncbi:receptor-like serine/threonine-protein kinase ALE2 [Ananas comosus]|uniref:Receptor-like serine/threonine-protein kinase ALE2 n=1 Tax=Ananas comosus TaxID=4615 RepID=A0A6P5GCA2_ANACO|nr:receptor-like serine/threonine-protein kinase ALE2 [Ananas comosus]
MRGLGRGIRPRHCRGLLKDSQRILLLNYLVTLLFVELIAEAKPTGYTSEVTLIAPDVSPLHGWRPLKSRRASFTIVDLSQKKIFSPQGVPSPARAPIPPPNYGSLRVVGLPSSNSLRLSNPSRKQDRRSDSALVPSPVTGAHSDSNSSTVPSGFSQPPLAPHTGCCRPNMVLKRGSKDCHCVYPVKVELFLRNVSLSSNWSNEFLEELASQLNLLVNQLEIDNFYVVGASGLNITMDIAPHTGISFSADQVNVMNSSLVQHNVRINPDLVGDYTLLNLTWFRPLAPSPAPALPVSPMASPPTKPYVPKPIKDPGDEKHSNLLIVVGICVGVLIVILIIVLIICSCASGKGKDEIPAKETAKPRAPDAVSVEGSIPHPTSTRFLPYEELKEATNNFEPASLLGEGGFGRVFKGVLSDGTAVAIKKLSSGGHQGDKEFLVEVEMLSRLHHRNLVKLIGYYSSRESSQNLLCYELVPNGSLESWLHGPLGANCPLDWDTRMKIALDAARGLAYLHEDSQPCVIHRDFKASNILLENNFHAKVSDFGLAKQAPEGRANYLSTRVMGTFGYVAPEYAMTGHLLVKSDVYSYGVVLLELLTGRRPVDMSQPSGQENLVTWARPILRDKDRLEELADPKLAGRYPKEDFIRVCTIAAACVASEANQRPTMGEVVQSLKMVQRVTEYQENVPTPSARPNIRQSSTTYESDGTSSMFSSGPFSGLSLFDNDNINRTNVFSEDLHEGR